MFSIVTTQKIIEKLYPEDSVWGNIVAQTKCFYVKLDTNWWEEDDKPLSDLYRNGAQIIDSADLFEDLDKHPEVIANYPTSVFILDIEEKEARQLRGDRHWMVRGPCRREELTDECHYYQRPKSVH